MKEKTTSLVRLCILSVVVFSSCTKDEGYPNVISQIHWQQKGIYGGSITSLAIAGTTFFAGTAGGVFRSSDNGNSWTSTNTGLLNLGVESLAIIGNNIFAATNYAGVYRSTNNGNSWASVNTGIQNQNVQSLAVNGDVIFAGTYGAGIFLSKDNGNSWTAVNNGLLADSVYSIATNNNSNKFDIGNKGNQRMVRRPSRLSRL